MRASVLFARRHRMRLRRTSRFEGDGERLGIRGGKANRPGIESGGVGSSEIENGLGEIEARAMAPSASLRRWPDSAESWVLSAELAGGSAEC